MMRRHLREAIAGALAGSVFVIPVIIMLVIQGAFK